MYRVGFPPVAAVQAAGSGGRKFKTCAHRNGVPARSPSGCLFRDCCSFMRRSPDISFLMVRQAGQIIRVVLGTERSVDRSDGYVRECSLGHKAMWLKMLKRYNASAHIRIVQTRSSGAEGMKALDSAGRHECARKHPEWWPCAAMWLKLQKNIQSKRAW